MRIPILLLASALFLDSASLGAAEPSIARIVISYAPEGPAKIGFVRTECGVLKTDISLRTQGNRSSHAGGADPSWQLGSVTLVVTDESYRASRALAIAARAESAATTGELSAPILTALTRNIAEVLDVELPKALEAHDHAIVIVVDGHPRASGEVVLPTQPDDDEAPPAAADSLDPTAFRLSEQEQIAKIDERRVERLLERREEQIQRLEGQNAWRAKRDQNRAEMRSDVAQATLQNEAQAAQFFAEARREHELGMAVVDARSQVLTQEQRANQAKFGARLEQTIRNAAENAKKIVAWIAGGADAAGAVSAANAAKNQQAAATDAVGDEPVANDGGDFTQPSPPRHLNLGVLPLQEPVAPSVTESASSSPPSSRANVPEGTVKTVFGPVEVLPPEEPDSEAQLAEQLEERMAATANAEWKHDGHTPLAVYKDFGFVRKIGDYEWWFDGDDLTSETATHRRPRDKPGDWKELGENANDRNRTPSVRLYPLTNVALAKFDGRYWRKSASSNSFEEVDRQNFQVIEKLQNEFDRDPEAFRYTFGLLDKGMKGAEIYLDVWAEFSTVASLAQHIGNAIREEPEENPTGQPPSIDSIGERPFLPLRGSFGRSQRGNSGNGADGSIRGPGAPGGDFIIKDPTPPPRRVRSRPVTVFDPEGQWGLRRVHIDKHFFGESQVALKQVDPGATADHWSQNVAELFTMPETKRTKNGMIDIIGTFKKSDGSGFYKMGVRLHERTDGTFDLVTVLTDQSRF